jgi:hypothetical protein
VPETKDVSPEFNEHIIAVKEFYVSADSADLDTSVRGTVFIDGDSNGKPARATIVAWMETDPRDWGGITFYLQPGWKVTHANSNYPDGVTSGADTRQAFLKVPPVLGATTYHYILEVGSAPFLTTGGGHGMVMFEMEPDSKEGIQDSFLIGVSVGSRIREDGVREKHTDSTSFEIPLSKTP